jgi:predicted AAA+ superfamily ATPase
VQFAIIVTVIERLLQRPERSFFLFGPRGVGKSTWLREVLPQATWFDLLDPQLQLSLQLAPGGLREQTEHLRAGSWVCVDEVQKVPALLDEVHALIERKRLKFALTGSSARKLRHGGANLLAGRASVLAMRPFSLRELGDVSIKPLLEFGGLPLVVNEPKDVADILRAYVNTYLREEIREEGLVRKVEPFVRFLRVAGLMNAQILNASNIAREAQVPRNSVVSYFSILEDTLVATRLPAFQPGARVRENAHPKFYWFDPGVARAAAGLIDDPVDNTWLGYALETWVLHELLVYNETQRRHREIFYYQTGAGVEVDFVVETRKKTLSSPAEAVLIEVKLADRWQPAFDKHLREVARSANFKVKACVGVYLGKQRLRREGVDVLSLPEFIAALYEGQFF